tara:strand:- start:2193 stop:3032 length:840 start_codon:yes stop_codon:yes gene_type:complete
VKNIQIKGLTIGNSNDFVLIAGLNVLESDSVNQEVVENCIAITEELNIPYIFKASYDKANRSSAKSYRGPGIEKGLKILHEIKNKYDVQIISDVHTTEEVRECSKLLDLIQIPAFLCRQTDLIQAAAETGLPVNIKKGQFLSPLDFKNIINKFIEFGNENILICERGTSFGYNNLVVDMLGMAVMKSFEYPVIFDVTHSLQEPGGKGASSGGRRAFALDLAKSGMALGLAGLFLEVHPNPNKALCDGPSALPLNLLKPFLKQIKEIDKVVKSLPSIEIE